MYTIKYHGDDGNNPNQNLFLTECQLPNISESGNLNFTTSPEDEAIVGTNITYFCNRGYELTGGNEAATCNSNGEWSSQTPNCSLLSK